MKALAKRIFLGLSLEMEHLGEGITRFRMSSRITRATALDVSAYLAGELLVDTGFTYAEQLIVEALAGARIEAICLTHHHEDHSGCCAALAAAHGCPIYLSHPEARLSEGLRRVPLYRQIYWGQPKPYEPIEMPPLVNTTTQSLAALPTPGHSSTHVALWDASTGTLFTGDLVVSFGVTAIMRHEDPYELVESLRRAADLEPARMMPAHGPVRDRPADLLRKKADLVEEAAYQAVALRKAGLPEREILARLFRSGRRRDKFTGLITTGEFRRENFVRAAWAKHRDE